MQLLRSFFKKAAEKPAFAQLLRRAAFNFGKGWTNFCAILVEGIMRNNSVKLF